MRMPKHGRQFFLWGGGGCLRELLRTGLKARHSKNVREKKTEVSELQETLQRKGLAT